MNTQHKKLLALAAVVALHVGVITLMLAQHGCKSGAQNSNPPATVTPTPTAAPAPAPVAAGDTGFYPPTQPAPEPVVAPLPAPLPVAQFAEPLANITSTPAPTPAPAPTVTWKVASGDTLTSIARRNGITVDELVAANAPKVTRNSPLSVGQVLTVPTHAAAPAPATPVAAADTDARTYKVAAGDSLSKIASRNGTTVKALKDLNGLTSDGIREGEVLKLPASAGGAAAGTGTASSPASASTDAGGGTYVVQSGDTLGKIAAKVGVKTSALMTTNGFTEATARNLRPGQTLKLPADAHAPDAATTTPTQVTPATVTPTTIMAPATSAPVPVTAFPATSGATSPPVTPVTPVNP
jgi:LysM repeat protein